MFARIEFKQLAKKENAALPTDWFPVLKDLINTYQPPNISKVDSLLVSVAGGDLPGGIMLKWLLYWYPRKAGQYLYKSATEWNAETGITEKVVYRCNHKVLPECGFAQAGLKKARGVPTSHYEFKPYIFLKRVAEVLNTPLISLISTIRANPFTPKGEIHLPQRVKSLTKEQTKNQTKEQKTVVNVSSLSSVEKMLIKNGVALKTAEEFKDLSLTLVQEVVADAISKEACHDLISTRQGFIVGVLRKYLSPKSRLEQTELSVEKTWESPHPLTPSPTGEGEIMPIEKPEPNPALTHQAIGDSSYTPSELWKVVVQQMKAQLDPQTFGWVRDAKLVDYAGGQFVLSVASRFAADMLEFRLSRSVTDIMTTLAEQPLSFRCEVNELPKPSFLLE